MADPLSISASIAGLIALSDLVFRKLLSYWKHVKHAQSDISRLSTEISTLSGSLHRLHLLTTQLDTDSSSTLIQPELLHECQMLLGKIKDKVPSVDKSGLTGRQAIKQTIQKLAWPFSLPEMETVLAQIERFKTSFNLALSAESMATLHTLQASQKRLGEDIHDIKQDWHRQRFIEKGIEIDQEHRKVLEFFGSVDHAKNHQTSRMTRHPNTGLWLTKGDQFMEWLGSPDTNLWLYGIPGAGKSVLASSVIEATKSPKPTEAIAYIYCDYKDPTHQDPYHIFGSIAAQLSIQNDDAFDVLKTHYLTVHEEEKQASRPHPSQIVDLIRKQVLAFKVTSIIVDGLDECGQHTEEVLDLWISLIKDCPGSIRTVVLSRDELIIRQRLCEETYSTMSIAAQSSDLQLYVASEIETRCRKRTLYVEDPELKDFILEKLVNNVQGMFRWVTCQLDYLCELPNDDECRLALDTLPPSLNETYERILDRILSRPEPTQRLVESSLRWILFARNPLTISKLCEAVSIQAGDKQRRRPATEEQILRHCSSLVRKSHDGNHLESAHFTVKEFFIGITTKAYSRLARFDMTIASSQLGKQCLTYLNFTDFQRHLPRDARSMRIFLANFPFYSHAACNWFSYTKGHWDSDSIRALGQQLFCPQKSSNFLLWYRAYVQAFLDGKHNFAYYFRLQNGEEHVDAMAIGMIEDIDRLGHSTLHWAALLGIPELVRWLILKDSDVNFVGFFGAPIHAAILGDRSEIMWRYLSHKNLLDARSASCQGGIVNRGLKSIEWNEQKKACVKILIENGANCETPFAISRAISVSVGELLVYTQDFSMLQLPPFSIPFLDSAAISRMKALANLSPHTFENIEECIAKEDCRDFFRQLIVTSKLLYSMNRDLDSDLDSELDWDLDLEDPNSLLLAAAENGQTDMLEEILNIQSININGCDASGNTALHKAAAIGSIGCMKLLLQRGSSIFSKDSKGWTALHHSAHTQNIESALILLDLGLDPCDTDCESRSLSHIAAEEDNKKLLELLHSRGGVKALQLNLRDNNGQTPLLSAAACGSENALMYLLEFGDINSRTEKGIPLLHIAAETCSGRTLSDLIASGADPLLKSEDSSTVLHHLVQNLHEVSHMVDILLERGVSCKDVRDNGSSPLHIIFSSQTTLPTKLFQKLIPFSDMNAVNSDGDSILHCLFHSRLYGIEKEDVSKTILEAGVSPILKNKAGDSYFHLLLREFKRSSHRLIRDSLSALIKRALYFIDDTETLSETVDGYRPLGILLENKNLALALLSKGVDPDLCDETGEELTAVEIACSGRENHVIDEILRRSRALDRPNKKGDFLIHTACKSLKPTDHIVRQLLELGANPNSKGEKGALPLIYAVQNRKIDVAKLLLEHDASAENRGGSGPNSQLEWNAAHWACVRGNLELLSTFIEWGVSWEARTRVFSHSSHGKKKILVNGLHYIHLAAMHMQSELLSFLLDHKLADSNVKATWNITPLHLAAWEGHVQCARILISRGADLDAKDDRGNTPLHFCISGCGGTAMILYLLQAGSLQVSNYSGSTAEVLALQEGKVHLAKIFQEYESKSKGQEEDRAALKTNRQSSLKVSLALAMQLENGKLNIFRKTLLDSGGSFDQEYERCGSCSLFLASLFLGKTDIAKWLFDSRCSVLSQITCDMHWKGLSATHLVMMHSNLSQILLKPLLDKGHHYLWKCSPVSPLHVAVDFNNLVGMRAFLQYFSPRPSVQPHSREVSAEKNRVPVQIVDQHLQDGRTTIPKELSPIHGKFLDPNLFGTPLHFAAFDNNLHATEILLHFGADPNSVDQRFETPIFKASLRGSKEVAKFLLQSGANPNFQNFQGASSLMIATQFSRHEIIQVLLECGADMSATNSWGTNVLGHASDAATLALFLNSESQARPHSVLGMNSNLESLILNSDSDFQPMACNDRLQCPPGAFNRVWKLLLRRGSTQVMNKFAMRHLWAAARGGKTRFLNSIWDKCLSAELDIEPHGKALFNSCTYGRLQSVQVLFMRGAKNQWPGWDIISKAFLRSQHHPAIRQWLLVGRFTKQAKIEHGGIEELDILPTASSSGSRKVEIPLVGLYARGKRSTLEYLLFLHSQDKQKLLDFSSSFLILL